MTFIVIASLRYCLSAFKFISKCLFSLNFVFNQTRLETLDGNVTGTSDFSLSPILKLERVDLEYVVVDVILSGSNIIVKVKEVKRLPLPVEPTVEVFTETELIVILVFGFLALLLILILIVVALYCCNPEKRKQWMAGRRKTKSERI